MSSWEHLQIDIVILVAVGAIAAGLFLLADELFRLPPKKKRKNAAQRTENSDICYENQYLVRSDSNEGTEDRSLSFDSNDNGYSATGTNRLTLSGSPDTGVSR